VQLSSLTSLFLLVLSSATFLAGQATQPPELLRDAASAFRAGDMTTAIRLYREFLAGHSDAAEIRSNLGAALVQSGQVQEGIAEYQTALKSMPNNPRVRMNLALAYYKLGHIPDAARELDAIYRAQPLELKPALLLADCLLQTDQPQKAVDLLTPVHAEYPDDTAVIYMLGMAQLKAGHAEAAQALLDKILRAGESAEAAFLLGQSAFARNEVMTALSYMEKAVALNPTLPGVHSLYAQVLRTAGKLDESAAQFREELKTNPNDFVANLEMALAMKKESNIDESLKYLGRSLQVRPKDPGALFQLASLRTMQGQTDEARQILEELVKEYPDFSEAHIALATVYYRLKRPADGDRERALGRRTPEAKTPGATAPATKPAN
jgi:tetratricopeptide (TPR) repeat protein